MSTYYSLRFPAKFILKVSKTHSTSYSYTSNSFFPPAYSRGKQTPFDLVLISLMNFPFKPHSEGFKGDMWDPWHSCRPFTQGWISPLPHNTTQNYENNPFLTIHFSPNYHRPHHSQLSYPSRSNLHLDQPKLCITCCLCSSHLKIFT